jgi:hypothetical protein
MQSRRIGAGLVARMVEVIVPYKVVVGKPDEKRPFGTPRLILRWIFRKRNECMDRIV